MLVKLVISSSSVAFSIPFVFKPVGVIVGPRLDRVFTQVFDKLFGDA